MTKCNKMLVSAVMAMSLGTSAFAQSSGTAGSANQTGGNAPAGGAMAPTDADRAAAGNVAATETRTMEPGQMGAMGKDADMKMMAQLDKIAGMGEKAGDALFVLSNAKGNMFEVEFAKLAQQKSQNAKVKELAAMIQKDHAAANEKLKPIATKMGLEMPASLPLEKQKMLAIFSAMSETDFNTCYVLDNKAMHAKDITSFADHQKSVKDEDLRGYVAATLPKLKEHGMHVQMVATEMGYPGMAGGKMDGMNHGGMDKTDMKPTNANGANNPTTPAGNQNPSNR